MCDCKKKCNLLGFDFYGSLNDSEVKPWYSFGVPGSLGLQTEKVRKGLNAECCLRPRHHGRMAHTAHWHVANMI